MTEEKEEEFSQGENEENEPAANKTDTEEGIDELKKEKIDEVKTVSVDELKKELLEYEDKYLRLYAEFENYKRLSVKKKEELLKYSGEDLMRELLSVIDHLELALQHSSNAESVSALEEGVQMTLKELKTTLEKFGLVTIESLGKPFDPFYHHAISQEESEESDENTVVAELRKGYMLKDRVLRAALVSVSKKPAKETQEEE